MSDITLTREELLTELGAALTHNRTLAARIDALQRAADTSELCGRAALDLYARSAAWRMDRRNGGTMELDLVALREVADRCWTAARLFCEVGRTPGLPKKGGC